MDYKLLILTDYPFPDEVPKGGLKKSIHTVVQELQKFSNVEVYVATLTNKVTKRTVISSGNLTVIYIPLLLSNCPLLVPSILTNHKIKMEIEILKPDIINVQGISKYYSFPIVNQIGIPNVLTVHGIIHQESKNWFGFLGQVRKIKGKSLEKKLLYRSRRIIVVSDYVRDFIEAMTNAKIFVVYNPVDKYYVNTNNNALKNRILFVGGIEERKGLEFLVEVIDEIKKTRPDIDLHIVGAVRKRHYYNNIIKLIKQRNLTDNIHFLGGLSNEELKIEYSEAKAFIMSSREESMGIVLIEAMAMGVPPVATKVGGIPNIIVDGYNGLLVEFGDVERMATSVIRLLSHEQYNDTIRENGKNYIERFSAEQITKEYLRVINETLSQF